MSNIDKERVTGVEPVFSAWKADIIATIRYPLFACISQLACPAGVKRMREKADTAPVLLAARHAGR